MNGDVEFENRLDKEYKIEKGRKFTVAVVVDKSIIRLKQLLRNILPFA